MKRVLNIVIRHAYGVYLGFSISEFTEIDIVNWQWWAIAIPVIALVGIKEYHEEWE